MKNAQVVCADLDGSLAQETAEDELSQRNVGLGVGLAGTGIFRTAARPSGYPVT